MYTIPNLTWILSHCIRYINMIKVPHQLMLSFHTQDPLLKAGPTKRRYAPSYNAPCLCQLQCLPSGICFGRSDPRRRQTKLQCKVPYKVHVSLTQVWQSTGWSGCTTECNCYCRCYNRLQPGVALSRQTNPRRAWNGSVPCVCKA